MKEMPVKNPHEVIQKMRTYLRSHICEMAGLEDSTGIELISLLHMLDHFLIQQMDQNEHSTTISGPRFGMLIRLYSEELRGNRNGITPTQFTQYQHVSKNTISSLLRGLEQQGLIQRLLDTQDLRLFRIQLTDAGRELVREQIPVRIDRMNWMVSDLSGEERQTLIHLLEKTYYSIANHLDQPAVDHAPVGDHGGKIAQSEHH